MHDSHDDLSDLERRLSDWRPSAVGLEPDALLFAAGRASVRPGVGRVVWPVVSGCLAVLVIALGAGLHSERTERLALAQHVRPQTAIPALIASLLPEPLPRDSYFAVRRALEQDPNTWLPHITADLPPAPPTPSEPILTVGQRGFWPDS